MAHKKIISFDLDGTLVDGTFGDQVWNHGIPEEYARKYGLSFDEAFAFIRGEYEAVGDGDLIWYDIEVWLRRFDLPVRPETLLDRYASHIRLFPDAEEALLRLSGRYRLVIASNAARIFVDKEVAHTGIGRYFEYIVSATTDLRMVKKGRPFYETLCRELGVGPGEIVHVGDHPVYDCEAPVSAGIEAYHLLRPGSGQGPAGGPSGNGRTIAALTELLEKL